MPSCRSFLSVLLLLNTALITRPESQFPSVKVKLDHSAVLPCTARCSGVVRWTVFHKPTDPLAECDQTSCRSVKEGYQMIYNQYLQGDLSLIISKVDYSKRGYYTCECDRKDVCDVQLQIEPLRSTVRAQHRGSVSLKLDVSDPVEVVYKRNGSAGVQICTVDGGSLQCEPEYKQRMSLFIKLGGMKESDSGDYAIRDVQNDEDLHIYSVSVQGARTNPIRPPESAGPGWMFYVLGMLEAVCVVLVVVTVCLWRKIQQLLHQKRLPSVFDTDSCATSV